MKVQKPQPLAAPQAAQQPAGSAAPPPWALWRSCPLKSMLAKTLQADEGGAAVAQPTSDAVSNAAAASAWRAWCGPHGGPIGEPNAGRRASIIITLLYRGCNPL